MENINTMKKIFTRIFVALAVLGLAIGAVSCNKNGDKNTGLGFWQVESEDAELAGYSSLYHAWYFHGKEEGFAEGFSILFLPKDDLEHWGTYDYAYIDIPASKTGEIHNLSDNLDEGDEDTGFLFWAGTRTIHVGNTDYQGTVFVSVNEEKNSITCRLDGTNEHGDKVKIDYVGYASPVDSRPYNLR